MDSAERHVKFLHHRSKRGHQRRAAPYQHIVVPWGQPAAACRHSDHLPQSATDPVALYGVTHLLRHGKPDADRLAFGAAACLHYKRWAARPQTGRRGPKIAPAFQPLNRERRNERADHALSRLRPWARRAATTLRPPLVAMRARNPCRRLRTNLLGW
jgi:hypothetical protein